MESMFAQVAGMGDPTLILWGALAGLGGFTAWLLRDYIADLKAQREAWRGLAYKGANVAEKAVESKV